MATDTVPAAVPMPPDPPPGAPAATTNDTPGKGILASMVAAVEPARPTTFRINPTTGSDAPAPASDGVVDRSAPGVSSETFRDAEQAAAHDASGKKRKAQGSIWKAWWLASAQRWAKGGGTANKRLDLKKAQAQAKAHQVKESRTSTVSNSGGLPVRNSGGAGAGSKGNGVKTPRNSGGKGPVNSSGNRSGGTGRGGTGGGSGSNGAHGSGGSGKQPANHSNGKGSPGGSGTSGAGGSGQSGKNSGSDTTKNGSGKNSGGHGSGSSKGSGDKGGGKDSGAGGGSGKQGSAGKNGAAGKDGKSGKGGAGSQPQPGSAGDQGKTGGKQNKGNGNKAAQYADTRTPLEKSRETGHGDGGAVRDVVDHMKAYAKGAKDGWDDKKAENAKEHARLDKAHNQQHNTAPEPKPNDAQAATNGKNDAPLHATAHGQTVTITDDNAPMEDPFMSRPTPIQAQGINANTITLGNAFLKPSIKRSELRRYKDYEGRLEARIDGLAKVVDATKALSDQAEKQAGECQQLADQARGVKGGEKLVGVLNRLADQAKSQALEAIEVHKQSMRAHDFAQAVLSNIQTRYAPLYQAVVDSDETKPAELTFYKDRGITPSNTTLAA